MSEARNGSPLDYFGSKVLKAQWLRRFFPLHRTYVSVFGGGASDLIAKMRSPIEVYNDLDSDVANFFAQLRNRSDALVRSLRDYIPNKEIFEHVRNMKAVADGIHAADCWDVEADIERAAFLFMRNRASYSGENPSKPKLSYGLLAPRYWQTYANTITHLPIYAKRFKGVEVTNLDYAEAISRYDALDTLFYCDPTYLRATRSNRAQHSYRHDLEDNADDKNHARLLATLVAAKGMMVVSGYDYNEHKKERVTVYDDYLLPMGWSKFTLVTSSYFTRLAHQSKRSNKRVECLWINQRARMVLKEHGSDILREAFLRYRG